MFGFLLSPVRSLLGGAEEQVVEPLRETRDIESHILEGVDAIRHATTSIEQHVEVIDTLANSVAPLGASVDRLTETMQELVKMLAPLGAMEREAGHVEHSLDRVQHAFGRRHHDEPDSPEAGRPLP
jgi:uncharacterized protein YoxC